MSKNRRSTSNILLDWFTISYRSIILSLVFLVGVGGAIFGFYYLRSAAADTPESAALRELTRAERMYREAESVSPKKGFEQALQSAQRLLASSRRDYHAGDFAGARALAVQSQKASKKILNTNDAESGFTAKIYRHEGDVKLKRVKKFLWEPVGSDIALRVGDQIKTASNGTAQIVYFDGAITTLKPNSLLEVRELFEDPSTRVRKVREKLNFGEVSSATQDGNVSGSFHEVATETSSTRTRGRTRLQVAFDQEKKQARMAVESGEAVVQAGKETVKLNVLESVTVDPARGLESKKNILPPPSLLEPIDQRVYVFARGKNSSTTLRWSRVQGAGSYRLQISQRPLFGRLLLDKSDISSNSVVLPDLSGGSYYWRVSARDGSGTEGAFSDTRKFRIGWEKERGPRDTVPPPLHLTDFLPSGTLVIIKGKTEPAAAVSIDGSPVDVDDDGAFTAVVKMRKDGLNKMEIVAQDITGNETRIKKNVFVETF